MQEADQPAIVSVVIPARVGQETVAAADACQKLWGRIGGIDCWIARGRQPSAQRNRAVGAAAGGWIYFLDDDSIPDAGNLDRAGGHFSQGVAGILITFVIGAIATAIYLWKRNLLILIVAHFMVDFIPNVLLPLIAGN